MFIGRYHISQNTSRILSLDKKEYGLELFNQFGVYYYFSQARDLKYQIDDKEKMININKLSLHLEQIDQYKYYFSKMYNQIQKEYTDQRHQIVNKTFKNAYQDKEMPNFLKYVCYGLALHYASECQFEFPYNLVLNDHPINNNGRQIQGRQSAFIIIFKLQQIMEPPLQDLKEFFFECLQKPQIC